jgi:chaperone modulatory protein CbpM
MGKLTKDVIVTGVVLDEGTTITLTEIQQRYHLEEELLQEMLEHGLIEPLPEQHTNSADVILHFSAVHRVESALHLYNDLGVNIAGAVLALDLLEQLEEVRGELMILQKQLNLK